MQTKGSDSRIIRQIAGALFMAIMFAVIIIVCINCGLDHVERPRLFNIGYNLIAFLASAVLYLCCALDGMQQDEDRRIFMWIIVCNFTAMGIDSVSYALDSLVQYRSANVIITPWMYGLDWIISYLILRYFAIAFNLIKEPIAGLIVKVASVGAVIGVVLALANYFVPVYYRVDENSVFIYEDLHFLCYAFPIVIAFVILAGAIGYRKKIQIKQFAAAVLYSVLTIGLILVSEFVSMFYINYAVTFLMLLFMYILVNIDRGNKTVVVKQEIGAARRIQTGILPSLKPDYDNVPEFDIYATMLPANEVGGNFYDFFMMDNRYLALVMGNVAGSGVGAALFMAAAKTMIHMRTQLGGSPDEALAGVNRQIIETSEESMEVDLWLGIVDLCTGHLKYSNANHANPVMLCNENGNRFAYDENIPDPPLGRNIDSTYTCYELDLKVGDSIFIYDGLSEISKDKQDAVEILRVLNKNKDMSNEQICGKMHESVENSLGDRQQKEDIAMLMYTLKQYKAEDAI